MTRPKRIDLPFCLYHVFSRTNSGDAAFYEDRDRRKFLFYIEKYLDVFHFSVHAYCLMQNHFHLLIESKDNPGLSEFMRRLLTAYTVYFNKKYGRHGHLFQGRFKSLIIDKSNYFLEVSRYIHLNPVRENDEFLPEEYYWSSLRYYLNGGGPEWLRKDETFDWFENDPGKYKNFVMEGLDEIGDEELHKNIYRQKYIGGEHFSKRIHARLKQHEAQKHKTTDKEDEQFMNCLKIVTRHYNLPSSAIMEKCYAKGDVREARLALIYLLRSKTPLSYRKIAEFMNFKTIQGAYQAWRRAKKSGKYFKILE